MNPFQERQSIIRFLRAALECSIYHAPTEPGLTYDELFEAGRRNGLQSGEISDAMDQVADMYFGQKDARLQLRSPDTVMLMDFNFIRRAEPDYRNPQAFNFVFDECYPADEADKYRNDPVVSDEPEVSEDQATAELAQLVDKSSVKQRGEGTAVVNVYGYRCAPDRLKVGYTKGDALQRIVQQISTSTPDLPVLFLEIRTDDERKALTLERALHSILTYRGQKVNGGGAEWFRTSTDEIERLWDFLEQNQK